MYRTCFTLLLGVLSNTIALLSTARSQPFSGNCDGLASAYATANPSCSLSSNCTVLTCSYDDGIDVNATVFNCEDPVRVVVSLRDMEQDCNYTYYYGNGKSNDVGLRGEPLHVIRTRNTTHLHLSVSSGTWPISNIIIPPVDIPLSPTMCMYDDFKEAASSFHLPPGLEESCTSETSICHGFHCNFTGIGETYSTCVTINPCNETLQVTIKDSLDQVQYDEVFSTNKSVTLNPPSGYSFTLRVQLHHYNYSMDAELTVIVGDLAFLLLPRRRFILDRSKCSPFIAYPAAPAPVADPMICSPPLFPVTASCSNLSASYAASNSGCKLSKDCLRVDCSLASARQSKLVVFNCEDPVRAVFTLTEPYGQCSRAYDVSGPGQISDKLLQREQISVTYSRNASHLQFAATGSFPLDSSGSFSNTVIIPPVQIPLVPGKCMFGDFVNTSQNIILPNQFTQSCVAETAKCGGILCNFTTSFEVFETCITIDPCAETLQIVIKDSLDTSVFDEVFSQSRSMHLQPQRGYPFTLYVILEHYNYSMEATMLVEIDNLPNIPGLNFGNLTILPRQRFILDRTKCHPFVSYPAAPDKWGTSMDCHAPVTSTPSTSNSTSSTRVSFGTTMALSTTTLISFGSTALSPGSHSHLTLAIIIPIVLVLVTVTATVIIIALLLVYRYFKKRREVGFRRIAFNANDMDDEEDDD